LGGVCEEVLSVGILGGELAVYEALIIVKLSGEFGVYEALFSENVVFPSGR